MNYRKFDGHQITPGAIKKVQSITRTADDNDYDGYDAPHTVLHLSEDFFCQDLYLVLM